MTLHSSAQERVSELHAAKDRAMMRWQDLYAAGRDTTQAKKDFSRALGIWLAAAYSMEREQETEAARRSNKICLSLSTNS